MVLRFTSTIISYHTVSTTFFISAHHHVPRTPTPLPPNSTHTPPHNYTSPLSSSSPHNTSHSNYDTTHNNHYHDRSSHPSYNSPMYKSHYSTARRPYNSYLSRILRLRWRACRSRSLDSRPRSSSWHRRGSPSLWRRRHRRWSGR